jgi:ABC-type uncharacterized transport system involved in gliding motility auxiliary subunit
MLNSITLSLLALISIAVGGITYSVSGEMGNLALSFIWIGFLALLMLLYVNFARLRGVLAQRSTKYGANMVVMITIFMLILGMISTMSVKYKIRLDLTADKRYSLSPQTVKLLKSLDRDVEAIAFYRSDERTRQAMYDLLQEYSYHSPRFSFWFIDPDRKPAEAAKYGVTSYRTTLLRSKGKQEILATETEEKITNSLMKVIRDQVKTVYFVKGHRENNLEDKTEYGYAAAKQFMELENYKVKEILLVGETPIPDDASILVISGPVNDLTPYELEKIDLFVRKRGRSAFFMLDPAPLPETLAYLETVGFKVGSDIIVDKLIRVMGTNYLTPVVMSYDKEHPLTKDMGDVYTFFPIARSVSIEKDPGKGRYVLAKTSSSSWARSKGQLKGDDVKFDENKDDKGPLGVMAVAAVAVQEFDKNNQPIKKPEEKPVENPVVKGAIAKVGDKVMEPLQAGVAQPKPTTISTKFGRIVVVGDSNFAGNTHIKLAGNKDLFLNVINWLAREESMISVRKKTPGLSPLTLSAAQGKLAFWLSVIITPSLFLALGAAVSIRRKRRT